MNENLVKLLSEQKLFPIIRSNDKDVVRNTANALIDGGAKIIEINAINPDIYYVIEEISKHVRVCAGGIITQLQANTAVNAGAEVFSSPINQMHLVKFSKDKRIPFIAGASTANEAYEAWKARVPLIKIFPITALGGVSYLENLLRPMPFLNIVPTGAAKLSEIRDYINAGAVAVGVGRDLLEGYSYSEISNRMKNILNELKD